MLVMNMWRDDSRERSAMVVPTGRSYSTCLLCIKRQASCIKHQASSIKEENKTKEKRRETLLKNEGTCGGLCGRNGLRTPDGLSMVVNVRVIRTAHVISPRKEKEVLK
jgi:hypothetical protein